MIRLTSSDGNSWLDVERLRPPRGMRRKPSGIPPFFWALITLHLPSDELGGYVAWNQTYLADFGAYFTQIESQPFGVPLLHRTEDDDVTLTASRDEGRTVDFTVRILDWWDPYVAHRSDDPRQELEGRFAATHAAVSAFARQLDRLTDGQT